MKAVDVINVLFQLQFDAKMYHWQTRSYANHKTIGDLFDALVLKTDEMVEVAIAHRGRPSMPAGAFVRIRNMTRRDMIERLISAVRFFQRLEVTSSDLAALRDDLLATLSKALYLMSFTN